MPSYLQAFGVVDTLGAATETLIAGATITVPAGQLALIQRLDAFGIGVTVTDITQIRLRVTDLVGAIMWMQARVDAGPLGGNVQVVVDNTAGVAPIVLVATAEHTAGLATDIEGITIFAVVQE